MSNKFVHVIKNSTEKNGRKVNTYTVVDAEGTEVPAIPEGVKSTYSFNKAMTFAFSRFCKDPAGIVGVRLDDVSPKDTPKED